MAINPLLLNVKPISEITTVDNPTNGHLLFYDGSDELKKVDIIEFQSLIGGIAKPLAITDASPNVVGWYKPTTSGTYANAGGLVAQEGYDTLFYFDGTTWSKVEVAFPQAPTAKLPLYSEIKSDNIFAGTQFIDDENGNIQYRVKSGQTLLTADIPANVVGTKVEQVGFKPSKTFDATNDVLSPTMKVTADNFPQKIAIFEPTKNLFDKSKIINGFYIHTTNGTLDVDATSAVSDWIPVNPSKVYYLSGRTSSINNVRFKDALGNILFPMENATTSATNYSKVANLILYVPPTAVAVQFIVKFVGTGDINTVQLEEGTVATSYEAFGTRNILLPSILPIEKKDLRVKRVGDLAYIAMPYSATQEVVQKMNVFRNVQNDNLNNNVNFESEHLIWKGTDITTAGTQLKVSDDDIAPPNLNGSYIGGNHGWNQPRKITKNAHGKTFADIGKLATDSVGNQFTIIQILDTNNFVLSAKNKAVDGFSYDFPAPNGTLTFPEGAFSDYTSASMGNTFDFLKSVDRRILVNGKTLLADGEEKYADYVDVVDVYDAYDLTTVVNILMANAGTYSANPDFTSIGADKLFRVELVYRYTGNTCLINQSFFNYKKISLSFLPFIQTLPLTSGNLYINKILPLSDGVKTWDFRKGEVWTTAPATLLQLAKANWESATNPPDRFVQYTSSYSFATGFVKDKGYQRENNTSAGWLHTTRKIYPYGVYSGTQTLNPYQSFSLQSFRSYQNRTPYPSGRISKVEWMDNGEYYLMLDWNTSVFENIALPKEVIGKQITIIEKTSNVSVLSTVATSELAINVVVDSTNVYGYLVLKIK